MWPDHRDCREGPPLPPPPLHPLPPPPDSVARGEQRLCPHWRLVLESSHTRSTRLAKTLTSGQTHFRTTSLWTHLHTTSWGTMCKKGRQRLWWGTTWLALCLCCRAQRRAYTGFCGTLSGSHQNSRTTLQLNMQSITISFKGRIMFSTPEHIPWKVYFRLIIFG